MVLDKHRGDARPRVHGGLWEGLNTRAIAAVGRESVRDLTVSQPLVQGSAAPASGAAATEREIRARCPYQCFLMFVTDGQAIGSGSSRYQAATMNPAFPSPHSCLSFPG